MDMKNKFSPITRVYILLRIADKESGMILARGSTFRSYQWKRLLNNLRESKRKQNKKHKTKKHRVKKKGRKTKCSEKRKQQQQQQQQKQKSDDAN